MNYHEFDLFVTEKLRNVKTARGYQSVMGKIRKSKKYSKFLRKIVKETKK